MSNYTDSFSYAHSALQTSAASKTKLEQTYTQPQIHVDSNNRNVSTSLPTVLGFGYEAVRMHITRIVPDDMSVDTCLGLGRKVCYICCAVAEAFRGRFRLESLENFVDRERYIQLQSMAQLLQSQPSSESKILPAVPEYMYATVVNSECFDATVGFHIGNQLHITAVVLRLQGSRWIVTHIDMG